MEERGIPMSGMNIGPIRADNKTHTRRIVSRLLKFGMVTEFGVSDTPGYDWHFRDREMRWHDISHERLRECCPYGQPGDRLWVREAWRTESDYYNDLSPSEMSGEENILYEADGDWSDNKTVGHYRHARFMPRWASRILLEITAVRVERLQDISEADAKAEGAAPYLLPTHPAVGPYKAGYCQLWESINGPGSWAENPFVWVINFRRITGGEGWAPEDQQALDRAMGGHQLRNHHLTEPIVKKEAE